MIIDFLALQQVMYDRLKNSDELTAIVSGVWDYVPDATLYPYVLFDTFSARSDRAVDTSRQLWAEQVLRAYSNDADPEKGFQQVREIATLLNLLFENQCLFIGKRRMQTFVNLVQFTRAEGTVRAATVNVQILFL
jgi:hypothetical protein